jgi:glycosyltransferase involved in cell wall biosynthesis
MLSIIIPTLNEEKYLGTLLDSIENTIGLDPAGLEIIVADGGSKDKTVAIAKSYGCKIVEGGSSPAHGRNEGAKKAKANTLLFLDADVVLPKDFKNKALDEFQKRNLDIATFCLVPRTKKEFKKLLFDVFYNWPILFFEKILSHASQAILVKRSLHEKVGGFDEKIKFAEDHSYVRKAKKLGKFGIIRSVKVLSSLRRFEEEGWIKLYSKYILAELHMIFFGDIKKDIFEYKFGQFEDKD